MLPIKTLCVDGPHFSAMAAVRITGNGSEAFQGKLHIRDFKDANRGLSHFRTEVIARVRVTLCVL